jgi:hypothetical protein
MKALPFLFGILLICGCTMQSPNAAQDTYDITYEVLGFGANSADIAYTNETGGMEFRNTRIPWAHNMVGKQGDFLYLSAHNTKGVGGVSVRISVNGKIRKNAVVEGSGIATADYRCCEF